MLIQIIAVGKLKEQYWADGIAEYMKRMGPYAKVQIVEVPDEKAPESLSVADELRVKGKEGERILAQVKSDAYVIALVIEGQPWTSVELARQLERLGTYGSSHVVFVIGGSLGLADEVLRRADAQLSMGRMTFPHQLMRVLVLEQVYRAFKIIRGEKYHK